MKLGKNEKKKIKNALLELAGGLFLIFLTVILRNFLDFDKTLPLLSIAIIQFLGAIVSIFGLYNLSKMLEE